MAKRCKSCTNFFVCDQVGWQNCSAFEQKEVCESQHAGKDESSVGVPKLRLIEPQKEVCGDCRDFNCDSQGNCNVPGYGTLSTNSSCDRFEPKPPEKNTKPTNPKYALGIKKVPTSCIPTQPMLEIGLAMMEGGRKYGRHNYRVVGTRASVYYDAAMRHLKSWWEGEDFDPDSGLHHLIKAAACCVVHRDSIIMGNNVDDRPPQYPHLLDLKALNDGAAALIEMYPNCVEPYTQKGQVNAKQD